MLESAISQGTSHGRIHFSDRTTEVLTAMFIPWISSIETTQINVVTDIMMYLAKSWIGVFGRRSKPCKHHVRANESGTVQFIPAANMNALLTNL